MVRLFSNDHVYKHPWKTVTSAFWLKYPNPESAHVREVDVFDREVVDGKLVTQRLIACESPMPAFMATFGVPARVYAAEKSTVDPKTKCLVTTSSNVTASNFLVVEETCTYTQHPENAKWTQYRQEAKIKSFVPIVRKKFEEYGVGNLAENASKGLHVMENLCTILSSEASDALSYFKQVARGTAPAHLWNSTSEE